MSDKSLFDIPMLMERNANSIGEATREMLRDLKRTSNEDIDLSGDPIPLFVNEVIQIVLDWMGTGEIEQVSELLDHIEEVEEYHEELSFAAIFAYSQPGMAKRYYILQRGIRKRGHWG